MRNLDGRWLGIVTDQSGRCFARWYGDKPTERAIAIDWRDRRSEFFRYFY
ncbi:hypothetical protein [Caulifigura coniformis]|nr:hypothetical protein [Caulifigura coniformis]